jgi:hypothetical protein
MGQHPGYAHVILSGSIPAGKLGIYMGIFNFFITLPQIVNGVFGGSIVKHIYGGQPIYAIVLAGFFLFCASYCVLFVYDAVISGSAEKAQNGNLMKKFISVPLLFLFYFAFSQNEIKFIHPAGGWV